MHHLSVLFGYGAWLKSLRFAEYGTINPYDGRKSFIYRGILDFQSYRGSVVLEFRNVNPTEEEIAEFEEASKGTCDFYYPHSHDTNPTTESKIPFLMSILRESDVPSDRKDRWSEVAY